MMCHMIGRPPISTSGFGLTTVSSLNRVPNPPASSATFISRLFQWKRQNDDAPGSRQPHQIVGKSTFLDMVAQHMKTHEVRLAELAIPESHLPQSFHKASD